MTSLTVLFRLMGGFYGPCIRQSPVLLCFCLRSTVRGLLWEMTSGGLPYSALVGLTVDTWYCQSTKAFA